jgi:hypothetical protein
MLQIFLACSCQDDRKDAECTVQRETEDGMTAGVIFFVFSLLLPVLLRLVADVGRAIDINTCSKKPIAETKH